VLVEFVAPQPLLRLPVEPRHPPHNPFFPLQHRLDVYPVGSEGVLSFFANGVLANALGCYQGVGLRSDVCLDEVVVASYYHQRRFAQWLTMVFVLYEASLQQQPFHQDPHSLCPFHLSRMSIFWASMVLHP
jgi:hypothetical protein